MILFNTRRAVYFMMNYDEFCGKLIRGKNSSTERETKEVLAAMAKTGENSASGAIYCLPSSCCLILTSSPSLALSKAEALPPFRDTSR